MKLYITRKFIYAKSAQDALKKDKKSPVDEVWLQEDWMKQEISKSLENKDNIGFNGKRNAKSSS